MMASQRPSSVGRIGEPGYSPCGTGTPGRQSAGTPLLPVAGAAAAFAASWCGCGAGAGAAAVAAAADWLLEGACALMAGACRSGGIAVALCAG